MVLWNDADGTVAPLSSRDLCGDNPDDRHLAIESANHDNASSLIFRPNDVREGIRFSPVGDGVIPFDLTERTLLHHANVFRDVVEQSTWMAPGTAKPHRRIAVVPRRAVDGPAAQARRYYRMRLRSLARP